MTMITCPSCGASDLVQRTSGVIGGGTLYHQGRNLVIGGLLGGPLHGTSAVFGNRSHDTTQSAIAARYSAPKPRHHPIILWSFALLLAWVAWHHHGVSGTIAGIVIIGLAGMWSGSKWYNRREWETQQVWLANSWYCHRCDRPFQPQAPLAPPTPPAPSPVWVPTSPTWLETPSGRTYYPERAHRRLNP